AKRARARDGRCPKRQPRGISSLIAARRITD
ncbi:MAG: hypothetical protein ACI9WU_002933, partial [Myxococcota bacterium]